MMTIHDRGLCYVTVHRYYIFLYTLIFYLFSEPQYFNPLKQKREHKFVKQIPKVRLQRYLDNQGFC